MFKVVHQTVVHVISLNCFSFRDKKKAQRVLQFDQGHTASGSVKLRFKPR